MHLQESHRADKIRCGALAHDAFAGLTRRYLDYYSSSDSI